MKSFTKFSLRFAVYLLVLGYLAADLYLFNGPLNRRIQASHPNSPESIAEAKANGVVARVFNHHITRTQLDRAIYERLHLEGKTLAQLSPNEIQLTEYAALGDLIDHELMRVKAKVNTHKLTVSEEEIHTRLERFTQKFNTQAELQDSLKSQGIGTLENLRHRIAGRIQQEKYVAMRVDPLCEVSEQEIADFYLTHQEKLRVPERIRVRHIFIPTLSTPLEKAKSTLETALAELLAGTKTFAELTHSLSQDPASKKLDGDLGWMTRNRLPHDFADPVFSLKLNQPTLIQTKIGYHIVEVTDRLPPELPALDSVREEIHSAIATTKRHQAVNDFRNALRRFEREKIDIFHDQLAQ